MKANNPVNKKALFNIEDIENLKHMLGIDPVYKKRDWGYRNHFLPGGNDAASMKRLNAAGLVVKGKPYQGTNFYHATEKGCELAGLSKSKTKKVLFVR